MTISRKRVQRGYGVHPDWAQVLDNVNIVLVETTHPGNIGSVARVMKNMGLKTLTLVSSTYCGPDTEAHARASGAYELVEKARREKELAQALGSCSMTVSTSARLGGKRTARPPEELIPQLLERAESSPVAVVFGRESRGMTNEEMKLCTDHMIIPTDARFASMNVAHAVAVIGYEIFKVASRPIGFQTRTFREASTEDREEMYHHMESVLVRAGFLQEDNPLRMMRDLRRIFNSARMDKRDITIVRGIFRKMNNMIRIADEKIRHLESGEDRG